MPLAINDLQTELMNSTLNQPNAQVAMKKMGDAISSYIMANALVNFSWVGVRPPPPPPPEPDPITVAVGKITGIVITLTPSMMTSAPQAMAFMANQIRTGVAMGTYMPDPPWSTSPGNLLTIPPLTLTPAGVAERSACFLHMATEIITWITGFVPTVVCSGSHTVYIGTATPVSIT
jgi:hypothetical protein